MQPVPAMVQPSVATTGVFSAIVLALVSVAPQVHDLELRRMEKEALAVVCGAGVRQPY